MHNFCTKLNNFKLNGNIINLISLENKEKKSTENQVLSKQDQMNKLMPITKPREISIIICIQIIKWVLMLLFKF